MRYDSDGGVGVLQCLYAPQRPRLMQQVEYPHGIYTVVTVYTGYIPD